MKNHTSALTLLVKPKPITMKFKLSVFFLTFCLLSVSLMAQEEQGHRRVHTIGLKFSNLNNFGITYKVGNIQNLFRVTSLLLDLNSGNVDGIAEDTNNYSAKGSSLGIGLRTGYERRIPLGKKFDLSLGADAGISYYNDEAYGSLVDDYTYREIIAGIYPVIGVNYQVGEHLVISAEISPGIYYQYGKSTNESGNYNEVVSKEWGFDLSTGSASITVAYRISKIILFKE
jgi:hypothetical protein